jgi:hypothetical protein
MKNKKILFIAVGVLILFTLMTYAETKKLKQIGRYTFVRIKGDVPTSEVMKTLIDRYTGDIKYGFTMAGYEDLYLPFLDQIRNESFEEKEIAVGEKWMWMLFRSKEKVKVVEDLEWAGEKPLPVFSFIVKKGYKNYEIVMPKPCGNISLLRVWKTIPPAVCDIKVTPPKANLNDPISVDMSGTQNATSMTVEVYNPSGEKIETKALTPDSPRWQTKFADPGEYTFKASAKNPEGKLSTNPCQAKTYINFPPICKLSTSCSPCENYVGRPITIDAAESTDPDGEVVKVDIEIRDEAGNIIDTYSDPEKPFTWLKTFDKPGIYTITGIATDDFGAVSEPASITLEVTQKRLFFYVDAWPGFFRGSHGYYGGLRLGLMYEIVPDLLDLTLGAGGALTFEDEPWKSVFVANALLNLHAGPAFFGGGLGYTTKVKDYREPDFELIGNIGFFVFDNWKSKGAVFFEGRGPVGEGKSFKYHHKLILGFRYFF